MVHSSRQVAFDNQDHAADIDFLTAFDGLYPAILRIEDLQWCGQRGSKQFRWREPDVVREEDSEFPRALSTVFRHVVVDFEHELRHIVGDGCPWNRQVDVDTKIHIEGGTLSNIVAVDRHWHDSDLFT